MKCVNPGVLQGRNQGRWFSSRWAGTVCEDSLSGHGTVCLSKYVSTYLWSLAILRAVSCSLLRVLGLGSSAGGLLVVIDLLQASLDQLLLRHSQGKSALKTTDR